MDDNASEFGTETYSREIAPGSHATRDDHYYLAGSYPDPIGPIAGEPFANFERAITSTDPAVSIYAMLPTHQASPLARFRITVHFVWSGSAAGRETVHDIVFRINGVPVATNFNFRGEALLSAEANANALSVNSLFPTVVEIERIGGTPDAWLGIDFVRLDVDPIGNVDSDRDGFPLYWERRYGFSDNDPNDLLGDFDNDGLSAAQERDRGTHPKKPDTDGDGLLDGHEIVSNPLMIDTDGDGLTDYAEAHHPVTPTAPNGADSDGDSFPDGWELQLGFNPMSHLSRPPNLRSLIGIQFVSGYPDLGFRALNPAAVAGAIPQINWNSTYPLIPWGVGNASPMRSGNTADIKLPSFGMLVDSSGAATGATIDFQHNGCWTTANDGGSVQRILNGYLLSRSTDPARMTMANVPYANYHVYVYVAADYVGPVARVRINDDTSTDIVFRPYAVAPETRFVKGRPATANRQFYGNYVCFTNITSRSLTVDVLREGNASSGLAAVQIVDALADHDTDGLPDWWELMHGFNPGQGGHSEEDVDQDGLNTLAEYQRGTDPRNRDTDGDGLEDPVESGTGTFVSAVNTGSDPLVVDTDGDGLSDGDEVSALMPSNPNLPDSDFDGIQDGFERRLGSPPTDNSIGRPPVPRFNPADNSLLWEIRHIQLRWNHDVPAETESGDTRQMLQLQVENEAEPSYQVFLMGLWERHGSLVGYFRLNNVGGFARRSSPGGDAWYVDWSGNNDISAAAGFSGFGSHDFSDPLAFRIHAAPGPTGIGDWTVSISISNEASGLIVTEYSESSMIAADSIRNRTAVWQSTDEDRPNESDYRLGEGISFHRSTSAVEDLPRYAAYKDTDNDGMPDAWEVAHGLDPDSASDAGLDNEPDGLSNRDEYLSGANPLLPDTDADGYSDLVELQRHSDPADPDSRPFTLANSISLAGDVNGNGFGDVWETIYRASGLLADGDEDGDTVMNWQEAILGTDPTVASAGFLGRVTRLSNQDIELRWPYIPRKSVRFFSASNILNFAQMVEPPQIQGGEMVCTVRGNQSQGFFTAALSDIDTDGDGVSDWAEIRMGSQTNSANSLRRATLYDSTGNGVGDSTISGDYAALLDRFGGVGEFTDTNHPNRPVNDTAAARLLLQATFGPTRRDILNVRRMGISAWIDDQINQQPPTLHRDYIEEIFRDFDGPRTQVTYSFNAMSDFVNGENVQTAFARAAVSGTDQLRQRVAFALSQILVISRQDGNLQNRPRGLSSYYDNFVTNAFGSYYDILRNVTFHPCMGRYLSHLGNQPPDPSINRYPDENYAREVMQLFSIGLWELNPDGTRKRDGSGEPIPTYSNEEITHLARVMTGFWFGKNPWGSGGWQDNDFAVPMELHAEYHDFDRKILPGGRVIPSRSPSRENALLDVEDALRMLFEHPNTPAFVAKALIQFLVTDNPSTNYVHRVHDRFVDNGNGVRGDMAAVVRAILLAPEARNPATAEADPTFGRLKEPVIRAMHLARLTKANRNGDMLWFNPDFYEDAFQAPLMAPTVFNFFRPNYQPPGVLKDNQLAGGVFQITTSYSAISFPNFLWRLSNRGFTHWRGYAFAPDFRDELLLIEDTEALLDHVNLLICGGRMSAGTREILRDAVNGAARPEAKARLAIYLALMAPEGAVQR